MEIYSIMVGFVEFAKVYWIAHFQKSEQSEGQLLK